MKALLPGATLGVFGGGQLGRMFAIAAQRMGYSVHVFAPDANSPAGQVATAETTADYANQKALTTFCRNVDAVTFEFENVPALVAEIAERYVPVRPSGHVLHICQHRLREKTMLRDVGLPVPLFAAVTDLQSLNRAAGTIGRPAVLKTASSGYDGKGQIKITAESDLATVWRDLRTTEAIYETLVPFTKELSVIGVRSATGETAFYGPIENEHRNHVLDISLCPAEVSENIRQDAIEITRAVLETLNVEGVLCVEMFLTQGGSLLVNELAPRPHNSGHLTLEAFATSQFEQQVRAVAGLPLGATEQLRPAAMANLLGQLWEGGDPYWQNALTTPAVSLHLYGKEIPVPGRKMGHLTATATTADIAVQRAVMARASLKGKPCESGCAVGKSITSP